MADKGKAVFRVVINGSQQAIFDELTRTDRPLGAIFRHAPHVRDVRCDGVRAAEEIEVRELAA